MRDRSWLLRSAGLALVAAPGLLAATAGEPASAQHARAAAKQTTRKTTTAKKTATRKTTTAVTTTVALPAANDTSWLAYGHDNQITKQVVSDRITNATAPTLFQPVGCPPLLATANKNGFEYLYAQNGISAGPIWSVGLGGDYPFIDGPAWSPLTNMLYMAGAHIPIDRTLPSTGQGVVAIKVTSGCKFSVAWAAPTGDGPQPPPIVVGNAVFASGGNSDVVALDALTGRTLWHAGTTGTSESSPAEAGNLLFTADGNTLVAWSP